MKYWTGWIKPELRPPGETQQTQIADDTTLKAEGEEHLESLLMRVTEESEKAGLKFNIFKEN